MCRKLSLCAATTHSGTWRGCSRTYLFPPQLHADYGEPSGRCQETASGSGVFTREWSKATVQMDCNSWTPQTTWK